MEFLNSALFVCNFYLQAEKKDLSSEFLSAKISKSYGFISNYNFIISSSWICSPLFYVEQSFGRQKRRPGPDFAAEPDESDSEITW
jgi:hypothetical protein